MEVQSCTFYLAYLPYFNMIVSSITECAWIHFFFFFHKKSKTTTPSVHFKTIKITSMVPFHKCLVIRAILFIWNVKKFSGTLQGNKKNCVELYNSTFIKKTLKISQYLYRFISEFTTSAFRYTLFKHAPLLSLSFIRSDQSFLLYFHRMLAVV